MKTINIGSVKVPLLDYAVSCTAILGIRDSGKTVTAKGIAEQLLDHDIPIIVFDAVGKWRWMKVPGTHAHARGYKVVVAGGRAPDIALTPHSVSEIVRSAVKEKIPLIIDLYDAKLSKADWRRIVQQSIRIIHYEANGVAHVFLEEAAEFIPQRVVDGEVFAEVEKLARMGGNASVGITLINQRSQEVNKSVLDLAHNLVLGCQIGNKAIEAIEKWVDRLSPETAKAVTTSLPHLKSGEAWVWTRSNPDDPRREQMPMCRSLHPDRRTPEVVLQSAKAIDPDEFVSRLNASIPKLVEEAKANDPAELRKENATLKREITTLRKAEIKELKPQEIPVLVDTELHHLKLAIHGFEGVKSKLEDVMKGLLVLAPIIETVQKEISKFTTLTGKNKNHWTLPSSDKFDQKPVAVRPQSPPRQFPQPKPLPPVANGLLPKCERAILTAAIQRHPSPSSRSQLALISGYSVGSGGFNNSLGKLRSMGYLTGGGDSNYPTMEGISALPDVPPLPAGEDLLNHWLSRLPKAERTLLEIIARSPHGIGREELGAESGYSHTSGGYNNALGKLRTLELIQRGWPAKPSPDLL